MSSNRLRRSAVVAMAAGLTLTAAACGDSDSGGTADGKVTFSVDCMPPKTAAVDRKTFEEDIATFEKANPDIRIKAQDAFPCADPKTFDAKLAGGQMADVFYVNYTDVARVVETGNAADISSYTADIPGYDDIQPSIKKIFEVDGKTYGLPRTNYSLGLLYNRALFARAGLDPDQPPTTWAEVRAAAEKIAGLGGGTLGYADYSAQNQGGWHLTAEIYSQGGDVVSSDGTKGNVNTPEAKAALKVLQDMRWADDSMGTKQLLTINDVQQMMGSGKLGMYIAAPDNVPLIVKQFKGSYKDLALAPMPGGRATLLGGDGYLVNKKAGKEQIEAGLKWLRFMNLTPGSGINNWKRAAELKAPVGLPQPNLWTGEFAEKDAESKAEHANIPSENYRLFAEGDSTLQGRLEPAKGQQIYSILDGVMSAVLTSEDADIDKLLTDANGKIDRILGH